MAFPATTNTLAAALINIQESANKLRIAVQATRDASSLGDTSRLRYIGVLQTIKEALDIWDIETNVPGLAAYAQEQFNDGTFDIVAEYNNMRTLTVNLRDWIVTNMPTDAGSGAILLRTVDQDGVFSDLVFTSVQTENFRTEADALLAAII
jgi:hypothetical protein